MTALAVLAGVLHSTSATAQKTPSEPGPIMVIDGDTVEQDGERWRLVGLDAPEIHRAKCASERERGIIAAARLVQVLAERGGVLVPAGRTRDKYGRRLGRLMVAGEDWAAISVREGLAVVWDGKGKAPSWCPGPES